MAPPSRSGPARPGAGRAGRDHPGHAVLHPRKETFSPANWHQQFKVGLGLDLSSGTQVVLQAATEKGAPPSPARCSRPSGSCSRVNGTGNSGAKVQQVGSDLINVPVPGKVAGSDRPGQHHRPAALPGGAGEGALHRRATPTPTPPTRQPRRRPSASPSARRARSATPRRRRAPAASATTSASAKASTPTAPPLASPRASPTGTHGERRSATRQGHRRARRRRPPPPRARRPPRPRRRRPPTETRPRSTRPR